ncbi:unnamed protein product [Toxocara canis]|uniref:Uncharacterized protein n=1 Tax=Toxocara canis TaxID=6265 RepID=A0A183UVN3_TOXCA|nr:unnamed protein product [Toxocara canis]
MDGNESPMFICFCPRSEGKENEEAGIVEFESSEEWVKIAARSKKTMKYLQDKNENSPRAGEEQYDTVCCTRSSTYYTE